MNELKKEHWEKCKQDNINLILQCKMQIQMAEQILLLVEEQIKLCQIKTTLQEEEKNTKSVTN